MIFDLFSKKIFAQNWLIFLIGIITLTSLQTLYSINFELFVNQSIKLMFCIFIFWVISKFSINWIYLSPFLYMASLILLCSNLFFLQGNVKRWINFAGIFMQFSEIAKIGFISMLCYVLQEKKINFKIILKTFIITLIPAILIALQPKFGTAAIFFIITASLIIAKKIPFKIKIILICAGLISGPIIWHKMLGYQKQRISSFLNPLNDLKKSGYQSNQSLIAIGNGYWKGAKNMHNELGFVPENYTDFIFCYFAEKNGFLISLLLILLIFTVIMQIIGFAAKLKNEFSKLLCISVGNLLFIESFLNIGMNIGIMPITGIPLPFFSYGGSSLITYFILIGLVKNVVDNQQL